MPLLQQGLAGKQHAGVDLAQHDRCGVQQVAAGLAQHAAFFAGEPDCAIATVPAKARVKAKPKINFFMIVIFTV